MIHKLNLEHLLFLDIETVPLRPEFRQLDVLEQELWEQKTEYQRKERSAEEFYERAGIWAEFGKIICISVGYFLYRGNKRTFRVTSFFGEEKELLISFKNLIEEHFSQTYHVLCAHNGKEFDFPYISRRMLINGIKLPQKLELFGKKPWEVTHLDTLELWRFGDYKNYTSLKLLTHVLNIPSPKGDMDGSGVRDAYYLDGNMDRIVNYCEQDVIAVAQVVLRLRNEELLSPEEIKNI